MKKVREGTGRKKKYVNRNIGTSEEDWEIEDRHIPRGIFESINKLNENTFIMKYL